MSDEGADTGVLTRRTLLKGAVGAAAVGGAGFGVLQLGSDGAEATANVSGLSSSDVTIESSDGSVSELTIDPSITIDWNNFGEQVDSVEINVQGGLESDSQVATIDLSTYAVDSPGTSGSFSPDIGTLQLLSDSGGPVDPADLKDSSEDGSPVQTDIRVQLVVTFKNASGSYIGPHVAEPTTFTVSVDNVAATATLGGTLNTDGS